MIEIEQQTVRQRNDRVQMYREYNQFDARTTVL